VYSLQLNQKSQQNDKAKRAYNHQSGEMAALYPASSADNISIPQDSADSNTSPQDVTEMSQSGWQTSAAMKTKRFI